MVHAPLSHDLVVHLARARKAANLTQAELAERAGLSRMTVQRLESGNLDPRLSTLHELTRVLDMKLQAVQAIQSIETVVALEALSSQPA